MHILFLSSLSWKDQLKGYVTYESFDVSILDVLVEMFVQEFD